MAIPVKYQQFKSAGIYRLVYDKSIIEGTDAELLRLVVGYSTKGPFNTPVYVSTPSEFKKVFGEGSKTLEKKGCFFHRSALQALQAGPILCLNLKPFDDESVAKIGIGDTVNPFEIVPVKSIYDRTRFWKLDPSKLNHNKEYMHICSIDSFETSNSIFVRNANRTLGFEYDVTVEDWYRNYGEDIPEFLLGLEDKKIKDFFTEIYVFKGKFDRDKLEQSNSPLKEYFDFYDKYKASDLCTINGLTYVKDTCKHISGDTYELLGSVQVNPVYMSVATEDPTKSELVYTHDLVSERNGEYFVTSTMNTNHPIKVDVCWYTDVNSHRVYFPEVTDDSGTAKLPKVKDLAGKLYLESTLSKDGQIVPASIRANVGDYKYDNGSFDSSFDEAFEVNSKLLSLNIKDTVKDAFGNDIDALEALYNDPNSAAVGHYVGCIIPEFYDRNYGPRSIDVIFNSDSDNHHMMLSLDENLLENTNTEANILESNYSVKVVGPDYQLTPIYVPGYMYTPLWNRNDTKSKLDWQDKVFKVLETEVGLRKALLSPAEIDYRYIVDTFESYWSASTPLKQQLAVLAKEKELCFAISNFYSVSRLMQDNEDVFGKHGVFDINTIPVNVNLPSELYGASYCGFFTPVKLYDEFKTTILCPSAALVSNLFIDKYNGRAPYNIVAGPNYGNIKIDGLIGPEYNFSRDELHVLEPFGVNALVYTKQFGTFINSNQTAKQTPKSALSAINVRELVIYLQDEIGKILQANQWEFNNATTRDAIKTKADVICEQTRKNGGLIAYYNQMDENNNTPDIIDNEFCVLSTSIEPGRGMGKMIHELTIYRTGQMSSNIISE